MKNYYKILEVKFDATEKEIKIAYAKKIREFPIEKYQEKGTEIIEAYGILSDAVRRKEYDAMFNHGDKIDKYEIDAEKAVANQDFKTAIELYKKILELEPDLAPIKHKMAVALLRNGQGDLAISEIKEAISLDPKNSLYYFDMARIYRTLGNNNRAEKSYLNAYKLNENNYNIIEAITDFYTDNKRYDSAISFLEKCTGKDSDNLFQDFSYLLEMINVYIKSNDSVNVNKIKKIVDRIKEITPENKQKDVALKFIDLIDEALQFKNEKIIRELCDSVLKFDKDNEQIKEFLKKWEDEESKSEEATHTTRSQASSQDNTQNKNQGNTQANAQTSDKTNSKADSRQEQAPPVYNINNTNIPISNLDKIKTIIIGCITLVVCGIIGLQLGIGVIVWLFAILPLRRKYNIEKKNRYNIPQLSLVHKILGYLIIMGICIMNVEGGLIGGTTDDRMVWGYILGYAAFCLFLHYFPGLGITKDAGLNIKTKKIQLLIEELFNNITGFFYALLKKGLIALLIIVTVIASVTIGYFTASKLQNDTQISSDENPINTQTQVSITDFTIGYSGALQYVGDEAVINIDEIYPSSINKSQVNFYVSSNNSNIIEVSDAKLFAVGEGNTTVTVSIDGIHKSLSFSIKDRTNKSKQNNYLCKESDSKYLIYNELYKSSNEELLFIRNEIYARHGAIFAEPYNTYFNSQNWYKGTTTAIYKNELNQYEISNINLINQILDASQINNNSNSITDNNASNIDNYNNNINNNTNNKLINTNPTSNEFICKNIDLIYLTKNDLSELSLYGLAILRNEIYAMHGYIFKEEPYKSYFNAKSWYYGVTDNVSDEMLNKYELANVKLIQSIENYN